MKRRIQKSLSVMLCMTLILSYAIFVMVIYQNNVSTMKNEVKQEAEYVSTAINHSSEDFLRDIEYVQSESRFTLVAADGEVVYDSKENEEKIENHKNRKEIAEALETGEGVSTRMSSTLGKTTYYYAIKLNDGKVLRVSKTMDSVLNTIFSLIPTFIIVAICMLILAVLLATWQTKRLIKPINELDIENPMENVIYNELKPLLVSMKESNYQKELTAQMRKDFSANVSHELKTPLTSISGYAELMMNRMVKSEDIPNFSGKIYSEVQRLIALIEDIIKLSKLDDENMELNFEEVELFSLAREVISRLTFQTEEKHIRIEISGEPVSIHGIRSVLDEMVYNVVENAVKYNVDGGKITLWIGSTLEGAKIMIEDTGIGIAKEDCERIFERFYRADKSHSKKIGGTGLGLSIVKHGAILHNAKVNVESEEGKGTKIEMIF